MTFSKFLTGSLLSLLFVACDHSTESDPVDPDGGTAFDASSQADGAPPEADDDAGDPQPTHDAGPTACGAGSWSASGSSPCVAHTLCTAGTYETRAPSGTSDRLCTPCVVGSHCPGGDGPLTSCASQGRFDHDANPATPCVEPRTCVAGERVLAQGDGVLTDRSCRACEPFSYSSGNNYAHCTPWTDCAPGTYVAALPSQTSDRICAVCSLGTFSEVANQSSCTAWNECSAGQYASAASAAKNRTCTACPSRTFSTEANLKGCNRWKVCAVQESAGSSTTDRVCTENWLVEFGVHNQDNLQTMVADAAGNVYVTGRTNGALDGQVHAGGIDVYARKYDAAGIHLWTRQFGTSGNDTANALSLDAGGNLFVVGVTDGQLAGQSAGDALLDAFVRKYRPDGVELWTRQFGAPDKTDQAWAAGADANGNVYVAGMTHGTLQGQATSGDDDAFLRKYDSQGAEIWTRQFGTSSSDRAHALSIDGDGNVYLAGSTHAAFAGYTSAGEDDVFLRKYDSAGTALWTRQFGSLAFDTLNAVGVHGSEVYVAGYVYVQGSGPSQDVFVRKYDATGTEQWTRTFGTSAVDVVASLAVSADSVYVAGSTNGTFAGQSNLGQYDAFLSKLDDAGTVRWTRQIGSFNDEGGVAVALSGSETLYFAGYGMLSIRPMFLVSFEP